MVCLLCGWAFFIGLFRFLVRIFYLLSSKRIAHIGNLKHLILLVFSVKCGTVVHGYIVELIRQVHRPGPIRRIRICQLDLVLLMNVDTLVNECVDFGIGKLVAASD